MARKSRRTTSASYRRRRLFWDDNAPSLTKDNHQSSSIPTKTPSLVGRGKRRLVTPSPRSTSRSRPSETVQTPSKKSHHKKQLFTEEETSSRRRVTAKTTPDSLNHPFLAQELCESRSREQSVPSRTGDIEKNSSTSSTGNSSVNVANRKHGKVKRKKTHPIPSKGVVAARKVNRYHRTRLVRLDSLACDASITTKGSETKKITVTSSRPKLDEKPKEQRVSRKSIPVNYISILASRATLDSHKTKPRSATEILDDFRKKREEMVKCTLKRKTRTRLPRSCKNNRIPEFRDFLNDEDIAGELDEEDDMDDDSKDEDWSEENKMTNRLYDDVSEVSENAALLANQSKGRSTNENVPKADQLIPQTHQRSSDCDDNVSQHRNDDTAPVNSHEWNRDGSSVTMESTSIGNCWRGEKTTKTNKPILRSDSGEQDVRKNAVNPKRKRGRPRKHSISATRNETTASLLPKDSSRALSKNPSSTRLSPCRSDHSNTKLSMEEYSQYSRHSRDKKSEPDRFKADEISDSPQAAESFRHDMRGTTSGLRRSKRSRNPARVAHQLKPPGKLILADEESQTSYFSFGHEIRDCSSRRLLEHKELSPSWEQKQGVSTSKKRVRFDSSTTTFSVKIKIKTNLDATGCSGQIEDKGNHGRSIASPLNESAVQAIANQVTRACLTQARTSNHGNVAPNGEPNIDVDVNFNEKDESSSRSSGGSSGNSHSSNDDGNVEGDRKNEYPQIIGETRPPIIEARIQNRYPSRKDYDDGRSVTSDLTSDWNRPSRFNRQGQEGESFVHNQSDNHQHAGDLGSTRLSHSAEKIQDYTTRSRTKNKTMPGYGSLIHRNGEARSLSSISGRKRVWGYTDSLARSLPMSKASVAKCSISEGIPADVSPQQPQLRSRGLVRTRNQISGAVSDNIFVSERDRGGDEERKTNNSETITTTPMSTFNRCGNCEGCRQTFDCQTCDSCLQRLYSYGCQTLWRTNSSSSCLLRRCQRSDRNGRDNSLLGLASASESNRGSLLLDNKKGHAYIAERSARDHGLEGNQVLTRTMTSTHSPDSAFRNTKLPWEDGDDWTVDYSYLSEPEYRRNWGKAIDPSGDRKVSPPTRSLSTYSRWLPSNEDHRNGRQHHRGRTSLSSISESLISQQKPSRLPAISSVSSTKERGGKVRGRKRKRDPLHGLALPSTCTDACSVTSWRENRKCLRALMGYDEADQDWV